MQLHNYSTLMARLVCNNYLQPMHWIEKVFFNLN